MAISIDDLGKKLAHLRKYCGDTSTAFAARFKVARSTLYGWGHGRDERANAGFLPDEHLPTLLKIIAEQLPSGASEDRAKALLLGPVDDFEAALLSGMPEALTHIIERDARWNTISAHLKNRAALSESDLSPKDTPTITLPIGHWFRLEVEIALRSGHCFALQNDGQNWGLYPAEVDLTSNRILAPGRRAPGDLAHLRERKSGDHLFAIIQSPEPLPPEIKRYQEDEIALDMTGLQRITSFYTSLNPARRFIYATRIRFIDPNTSSTHREDR